MVKYTSKKGTLRQMDQQIFFVCKDDYFSTIAHSGSPRGKINRTKCLDLGRLNLHGEKHHRKNRLSTTPDKRLSDPETLGGMG